MSTKPGVPGITGMKPYVAGQGYPASTKRSRTGNNANDETDAGTVVKTETTVVTERVKTYKNSGMDGGLNQAREHYEDGQVFGRNSTWMEYIRWTLMNLVVSLTVSFFIGLLRGVGNNAISYGLGSFFIYYALIALSYSEVRGIITPMFVFIAVATRRITIKYGLIAFFVQVGGYAAGYGIVRGLNFQESIIIADGAPLINTAYLGQFGYTFGFEFLFTLFFYIALAWSYALRDIQRGYHWMLKTKWSILSSNGNLPEMKTVLYQAHNDLVMGTPGYESSALLTGAVAGASSLIGFSITGASLDWFHFMWPATYNGILANYPDWWIYFVASVCAVILAIAMTWLAIYIVRKSGEVRLAEMDEPSYWEMVEMKDAKEKSS